MYIVLLYLVTHFLEVPRALHTSSQLLINVTNPSFQQISQFLLEAGILCSPLWSYGTTLFTIKNIIVNLELTGGVWALSAMTSKK